MVEAAGVEPACRATEPIATTCLAEREFLIAGSRFSDESRNPARRIISTCSAVAPLKIYSCYSRPAAVAGVQRWTSQH